MALDVNGCAVEPGDTLHVSCDVDTSNAGESCLCDVIGALGDGALAVDVSGVEEVEVAEPVGVKEEVLLDEKWSGADEEKCDQQAERRRGDRSLHYQAVGAARRNQGDRSEERQDKGEESIIIFPFLQDRWQSQAETSQSDDGEDDDAVVAEEGEDKGERDGHGEEGQGDHDPSPDHVPACDEVASVPIVREDIRAKQADVKSENPEPDPKEPLLVEGDKGLPPGAGAVLCLQLIASYACSPACFCLLVSDCRSPFINNVPVLLFLHV